MLDVGCWMLDFRCWWLVVGGWWLVVGSRIVAGQVLDDFGGFLCNIESFEKYKK
jgi:hypothetical protein